MSVRWLAALDLDGTLIGHDLEVRPPVRAAIAAARAAGHVVTIATGRTYMATLPFAQQVGLEDEPLICSQGGQVRHPGATLFEQSLDLATAHAVSQWGARRGITVFAYLHDKEYIPQHGHDVPFYVGMHPTAVLHEVGDLTAFLREPPLKLLVTVEAAEAEAIQAELHALVGTAAAVVRSHARYVEVVHPGVNKGNALRVLATALGIPLAQTLGVGDNHNDLPLLQAAGVAVAMGNGTAEVKAQATWVAPTVEEDGAAAALWRFLPGMAPT